jgi:hypothetical protein
LEYALQLQYLVTTFKKGDNFSAAQSSVATFFVSNFRHQHPQLLQATFLVMQLPEAGDLIIATLVGD